MKPLQDWDDAFSNMAHIPGSSILPEVWAADAARYRAQNSAVEQDVPYGDDPRARFDIVWPDGVPRGLAVFIHGGFWMQLDKSYWTHFAQGAVARGWAVCLPSYPLAPDARIGQMTRQIGAAIDQAAARVAGPIHLSGHSAGGHLATRMICDDSPLGAATLARIAKTLSISGLHDLRPLLHTKMNTTLHLDEAEAVLESAALHRPATANPLVCWVGANERPEFIRQSQVLAMIWSGLDIPAVCHLAQGQNHFTVIDGLKDPDSPIIKAWLDEPAHG